MKSALWGGGDAGVGLQMYSKILQWIAELRHDVVRFNTVHYLHPMISANAKGQRIEIRASKENKELLRYAAAIDGLSVSEFVISIALQAARERIIDQERIRYTSEDLNMIYKLLDEQSPLPNPEMERVVNELKGIVTINV